MKPSFAVHPATLTDVVRPMLVALPAAAIHLHTLVTVGPTVRTATGRRLTESVERIDAACSHARAQVGVLPRHHGSGVLDIGEAASALAATLAAAADATLTNTRPVPVPPLCADHARSVVHYTELAAVDGFPRQQRHRPPNRWWQPGEVLTLVLTARDEANIVLNILIAAAWSGPSVTEPPRVATSFGGY